GEWRAFGPRLSLKGMTLHSAAGLAAVDELATRAEVVIESAALDVKPLNLLIPGRALYSFRVIGADFELVRTADGQLKLSGLGVTHREGQPSALHELSRVGGVTLEDSSLLFRDEMNGVRLGFSNIEGRLDLKGDRFSTEIQASLFDERSQLVYGDIQATLQLVLGAGQKLERAQWRVIARELMLTAFQDRLPPNAFLPHTGWLNSELWGAWSAAEGHGIKGVLDLKDGRLTNERRELRIDRLNSKLDWRFGAQRNWSLDLADVLYDDGQRRWQTARLSLARDVANDLGLWISADELPLDLSLELTRDIMSFSGTPWPAFLPERAAGRALDMDLVLDAGWQVDYARGVLQQAGVLDWDRWPDLRGLDGEVSLANGSGQLALRADELQIDWPRVFRQPLSLHLPRCPLDLRWGNDLQLRANHCSLVNDDLAVEASVTVSANEGKPALDVNAAVSRGDVGRAHVYLPTTLLKEGTRTWLRRALQGGDLLAGRFQIHGDLDEWPFRGGEGRFEALAQVENGQLHYLDAWPDAKGVDASLHFSGTAMDVHGSIADIAGAVVESARARIPDLQRPVLELDYSSGSDLPGLITFLQSTPLREQIGVDLTEFEFAGAAVTTGALTFPLGQQAREVDLEGRLQLTDGHFSDPRTEVTLESLQGELTYDESGFEGAGLDTVLRGYRATLDLAAGANRPQLFRADLSGVFGVRDLVPDFLYERHPALERVTGASAARISVLVENGAAPGSPVRPLLQVESELYGVVSELPEPLSKAGDEGWPFSLRYPLAGSTRQLDLAIPGLASLHIDIPEDEGTPAAAVIHLGAGTPAALEAGKIRCEGQAQTLDLDGWIDAVMKSVAVADGSQGLELERGAISADVLKFMDRKFADVDIEFSLAEEGIGAQFAAEELDGSLRLTLADGSMRSLTAEFERLVLGTPVADGMDVDTDPSALPDLHLYVGSFRYLGVELGETRIEAYPTTTGFHFEKVDASSDQLSVQASGDWLLDENGQRSDFDIHIAAESLGGFLDSMDIDSSVEGGQTVVDFNAWWPGSPAAFALSRLNGQLEFSVVDGNIRTAGSGGGRLLGLLSVQALPRRLALDFRDVFDSGFSFDEATGSFAMQQGKARTDDVLLKSSAASISISGTTDLAAQQYDQLLTIRPGVGNTLPILGALTGGPGGAAAGLALQGLLHAQLGEATKVRYRVTGSWDEPLFEPVEIELPVDEPATSAPERDLPAVNEPGANESQAGESTASPPATDEADE
ncbi:MAG: YhdP family protein, partial [Xanthomonadales bacterium]|nr:YhdP family protein [Xanthomonadales bacterium]